MNNKKSILFVDDEPINLMLFEICFSEKYEVITAKSGYEGLDILERQNDISFVFSDMKMPKMNGIEFIAEAKKKYPDKKYYILTGFGLTDEISKALEDGLINKCLFKPFDIDDIESVIEGK